MMPAERARAPVCSNQRCCVRMYVYVSAAVTEQIVTAELATHSRRRANADEHFQF